MKAAVFASVVSTTAFAGGSLAITWSDCGSASTHAKTTDVSPASLPLGSETAITGTGDLDKTVTGGTYDMELKAGGGIIDSHFTGNNCDQKDFDLPLGLGKLSWDGLACPLAAGSGVKIGFKTTLAAALPPALATSTIGLKAVDQDNEQVLCVDLSLKSASEATAGACSAADQAALADAKTVGDKQDKCGKQALSLTGIDHDKFTSCAQTELSISAACSECYYTVADYGFKNCKAACLLGWCKSGCLSCTQPAQDDLPKCTGFQAATADPCLEMTATGACSADDQAALADSATVGKAGSDCGLGAYNPLTGAFNHDKFNTCFTGKLSISSGCSECYATNGEFAAKHCKAACLLGWCKQGCLDCSTADEPKSALDACTGFTSGSADPCLDDITV